MNELTSVSRRALLAGGAAAASGAGLYPAWAMSVSPGLAAAKGSSTLAGNDLAITVARHSFTVDGRTGHAVAMNGTILGPLVRLKEGENVRLAIRNELGEDTSIHWHGLLVPFQMDGVLGSASPASRRSRPSSTSFPSGSPAPTGTTAIPACRSRSGIMDRSSSILPGPTRSPTTASM